MSRNQKLAMVSVVIMIDSTVTTYGDHVVDYAFLCQRFAGPRVFTVQHCIQ